jgi:Heavy metal associated domain 2
MTEANTTIPVARIAHRLPGRMRLTVAARRGDATYFTTTTEQLRGVPGVTRATGNPLTGSFVIEYDSAASGGFGAILAAARQAGIFELIDSSTEGGRARPGTKSLPLNATAVGFAGLGLYQLSQGQAVGNAAENLWNAYGAIATLRRPLVAMVLLGLGLYQVANGQLLGSASSLLFYALSARHMAQTGDPEAAG